MSVTPAVSGGFEIGGRLKSAAKCLCIAGYDNIFAWDGEIRGEAGAEVAVAGEAEAIAGIAVAAGHGRDKAYASSAMGECPITSGAVALDIGAGCQFVIVAEVFPEGFEV